MFGFPSKKLVTTGDALHAHGARHATWLSNTFLFSIPTPTLPLPIWAKYFTTGESPGAGWVDWSTLPEAPRTEPRCATPAVSRVLSVVLFES